MQQPHLLSHHDGSRRNNFTAIRFVLAWMVIYAHSFALQPAAGIRNPLGPILQGSTTTGQMAVDGFFAISGFLVAGSLLKRGLLDYALSRILRVLPGLMVCVLLIVFLLGPLVTNLSFSEYFSHSATYRYLSNALAWPLTVYNLPGVFEGHKHSSVNGSLWSIPYEVRCYTALAFVGVLGIFARRVVANLALVAIAMACLLSYVNPETFGLAQHVSSALLGFALGVLLFINRDRVILDYRLAILAGLALYFSFGQPWFRYVYPFVWPYLLFYLAYQTRYMDIDGKVGDCSYGIYIYAFPTQQLAVYLFPAGNPYTNMLFTTAIVVPLALVSWRVIEKPALGLKRKYLTQIPETPASA